MKKSILPFYACKEWQIVAILTKHGSNASSEIGVPNCVLS